MDRPEYKDLSYNDMLNIAYWAQFGFVHNMISSGDKLDDSSFKNVTIPRLGSFIAHPKRVQKKVNYHKNKEENDESDI